MSTKRRVLGVAVAAALTLGGFAPSVATADESDTAALPSSVLEQLQDSSNDESMSIGEAIDQETGVSETQTPQTQNDDATSSDADETQTGASEEETSTQSDGTQSDTATVLADGARTALEQILSDTEEDDLTPLASGYRADDSGTAPYDSVKPNDDDLKDLQSARDAAQKLLDADDSTDDELTAAGEAVQTAFDAVRFIYHYTGFTGTNGARMFDNNGNLIQAHGAGFVHAKVSTIAKEDRSLDENGDGYIYIWCGEDKTDRLVAHGVRIYYSDDLYNWVDKGLGFQTYLGDADLEDKMNGADPVYQQYYNVDNISTDPDYTNIYGEDFSVFADDASNYNIDSAQDALDKLLWDLKALYGDGSDATKTSCVFERPKMAYNEATGRWVIWFHADGPQYGNEDTATYSKAKAGVAISTTSDPAGPYKYLGSFRLNTGDNTGNPGMARDMNLYIDDKDANNDGVNDAYLIYASDENTDMTISLLDKTYTKLAKPISEESRGTDVANGDTYNTVSWDSRESPAPVKWNGHYYIIYSHTTGWAPNQNEVMVSEGDNILGPYTNEGSPFVAGDGVEQDPSDSFYTQSSSIIPVDESKGLYIYFGDRWFNPDTGNDISQSRYVMTPIQFVGDEIRVLPQGDWTLEDLNQYESVQISDTGNDDLPSSATSMSELMENLPDTISVVRGGNNGHEGTVSEQRVVWDVYTGEDQPFGDVTITGKLPDLSNLSISYEVTIYPKDAVLYIDAGSDPDNESDYYTQLKKQDTSLINTDASDGAYTEEAGWGYSSTVGSDGDMQRYGTDSNDPYETGWYANSGKSIDYKADLKAGTYTVTAGFRDWWSEWNNRWVDFVVSAGDETLGTVEVGSIEDGMDSDPITFTLDSDQTVTFSVKGKAGQDSSGNWVNLDPVLSWIHVLSRADDEVVSVTAEDEVHSYFNTDDGADMSTLPSEVEVQLADGSAETRSVTWNLTDANDGKPFALTEIQGTVRGTTLPATMTVQMIPQASYEYFIDVHGADGSGTYDRLSKLMGNDRLLNATYDQTYDSNTGDWGNSTDVAYGTRGGSIDDPYSTGIYCNENDDSNKYLTYKITLPGGTHDVSFGFQDWWSVGRGTGITYQFDGSDEQELAYHTVGGSPSVATGSVALPDGQDTTVTFTVRSTTGTGPVLSWIAASQETSSTTEPTPVSVKDGEVQVEVVAGEEPVLPETVKVEYSDGSVKELSVTWNDADIDWSEQAAGDTVQLTGDIEGIDPSVLTASAKVTVTAKSGEVDPTPINAAPRLSGVVDTTIAVGDSFDPMAGVSAHDDEEGDISASITVSGSVDVDKEGVYTLTYRVSDSQGATATAVRTVTVKANESTDDSKSDEDGAPADGNTASKSDASLPDTGSSIVGIAIVGMMMLAGAVMLRRRRG